MTIRCAEHADILQIDNLWCFTSLVRLQLDNNLIEKIENLDDLVNLTWLGIIIHFYLYINNRLTITVINYGGRASKLGGIVNMSVRVH